MTIIVKSKHVFQYGYEQSGSIEGYETSIKL